MVYFLGTPTSGYLLSTQRWGGGHSKLAGSTSVNTQGMHSWLWMSFVIWWEEKRLSPTECSTMLQVFVAPGSTGSDSRVDSSPWLIPSDYLPSSLPTVQLICNGQSWPAWICPENPDNPAAQVKAVNENPAIADWFFCHRVQKFVDAFYLGVVSAEGHRLLDAIWVATFWQPTCMYMVQHGYLMPRM